VFGPAWSRIKEKWVIGSDIYAMRLSKLAADEADCQRLQIPHRFMQMSALSPSTRDSHAARSGELFTADEVREWLAKDDNSVGCKCSFVLVLVDDAGNPRSPALVQKLILARDNFFAFRNQSS
jgi:hypothetical protein